ncbi:CocE/NonD family hydrolase [Pontibacter sp. G13]|uniref:CocE/NonD family hydrolase n=1 Tax=Pontibacter sp. G13 TaxID=3074898 RepID=UPI00288BA33F|nr:CocE/NonD family hydrolase [Pontibacter sp. G13]WNJ18071.1 CocE/NonD family hydrolase [Pontibacter sp. G13]
MPRTFTRFWTYCCILIMGMVFAEPLFGQTQVSTFFQYKGYSKASYKSYDRTSEYVRLSDGTDIATDVYLPQKGPEQSSFPTVFVFTPYGRAYVFPKMGLFMHLGSWMTGRGWGPVYDQAVFDPTVELLLKHGYAVVVSDMRGSGASFGSNMPFMPRLGLDGKEMVDWIAGQSWCNGQVGMMGASYLGWAQYATAGYRPEALKAIMPQVIPMDIYTGAARPGGIAVIGLIEDYDDVLTRFNLNFFDRKDFKLPSLPVVDEDGDGKIKDEWPRLDSTTVNTADPPFYKDKADRFDDFYYQATLQHLDNLTPQLVLEDELRYRDAHAPIPYDSVTFPMMSPGNWMDEIAESGIAVYHVGGWFDAFSKGAPKMFATLAPTNPSHLLMGPRPHFPMIPKALGKQIDYRGDYRKDLATEHLRFFDRYLKGIPNGWENEPPVHYYQVHQGWMSAAEWPLRQTEWKDLWVADEGRLALSQASAVADTYQVDFEALSYPNKETFSRWKITSIDGDQSLDRSKLDVKCLVYESIPLEEDWAVVGHPMLELFLESNRPDGDLHVYLEEVNAEGGVTLVSETHLRASFHRMPESENQGFSGVTVKPDLPWHGYEVEDVDTLALLSVAPACLRMDFMPVAWTFRRGNSIRISIAGADASMFELHPDLCPDGVPAFCLPTEYRVYRSAPFLSKISLPILPSIKETDSASAIEPDSEDK